MSIETTGKVFQTDDEGYLVKLGDWDQDVARAVAKSDGLELTPSHWEIVNFLRDYYEEFQIAPAMRVMARAVGKKLGPDKGDSTYLEALFPGGPAKQGCKIAGLPKPSGCV